MYCRNCGNKLNENSKFCTNCGSPINNVAQPQQVQKQTPKILKFLPFIIIGVVLLIIAGIASFLLIVGKDIVTSKNPITASEFKTTMEEEDFIIKDVTTQFSNYSYVNKAYLAISEDYTYQIEFYDLSNSDYAKNFYDNNVEVFKKETGSGSTYSYVNFDKYSRYSQEANNKYQVISRIENTAVYVNVNSKYKDDVKDILDDIGY